MSLIKYLSFAITISISILACKSIGDHPSSSESYQGLNSDAPESLKAFDKAHKVADFYDFECVSFDITLNFGGAERFRGTIYSMTNSSAIRLDFADGKKLLYTHGDVYTTTAPSKLSKDRFSIFTWQYFFFAPFKLSDKGTKWEDLPPLIMDGEGYRTSMLTFEDGVGDASNDWYILHADSDTDLIKHMGYIVTAGGRTIEEAEASAHAISYFDYEDIQGVPFAHRWVFSEYEKGVGLGKQIGDATITNIRLDESKKTFNPKQDPLFIKYDKEERR